MRQRTIVYSAIVFVGLILAGYVYIYQAQPFPLPSNDYIIYFAFPFGALFPAIAVTAVLLSYQKDDKPYEIWQFLAIGLWVWVFAETIFAYLEVVLDDTPPPGLAEVCWLLGYGLIAFSLYKQYQLITKEKIAAWKPIAISLGVILLSPLLLFIFEIPFSLKDFIAYLYPLVDFAICIAALRLYILFGGGRLSRPWVGLFVLGIADAISAWQTATNVEGGQVFSTTIYLAAYFILAIGFLRQYLLLHFGPE